MSRPRKKGRIAFLRTLLKEPLPERESALVARDTEMAPAVSHEQILVILVTFYEDDDSWPYFGTQ